MKKPAPKLPLTADERSSLRALKIKLAEVVGMDASDLSQILNCSTQRAKELIGLAQFQSVPSIGPKVAERVVNMGYYHLEEIKNMEGADFINRMEAQLGYWEDPCLEDALRCLVYHANHPGSDREWIDFTEERKQYRQQNGYPSTRPAAAWYEKRDKGADQK